LISQAPRLFGLRQPSLRRHGSTGSLPSGFAHDVLTLSAAIS
jgi:hypothetical protein